MSLILRKEEKVQYGSTKFFLISDRSKRIMNKDSGYCKSSTEGSGQIFYCRYCRCGVLNRFDQKTKNLKYSIVISKNYIEN